ncbi:MAG: DUF3800 domain-containing protein [Terriglobales bacterium]
MYILYIDESGDGGVTAGSSRHLVLAGAAMHEGQWRGITKSLDDLQDAHFPHAGSPIEFHAHEVRGGKKAFKGMPLTERTKIMHEGYTAIASVHQGLTLFGAVIDKPALMYKYTGRVEPYHRGFESLCTMFNYFLQKIQRKNKTVMRGIVVFDEARPSLTKQIRKLLAQFHAGGTRWAQMTNLIETAFFFDSRTSRLVQIADFTAYALFRWYESKDDTYLKLILHKFDREGDKIHGLKCYPMESTCPFPPPAATRN